MLNENDMITISHCVACWKAITYHIKELIKRYWMLDHQIKNGDRNSQQESCAEHSAEMITLLFYK